MSKARSVTGRIGETVNLITKFYANGVLFNPHSIVSVKIYDSENNLIDTLSPTQNSIGVYQASWSVPTGLTPGIYTDTWVWQATTDTPTKSQSYTFRVDGAYSTNTTRSTKGPLFVTNKEIDFFNHIGKELIQRVVGQKVIYYAVSEEHTKSHRLYDEAIRKTVFTPVEINALVLYKNPSQTNTHFSIDTVYYIEVYFQIHELQERKMVPREGDFVKFANIVYEIEKLTKPQLFYGQPQNEVMIKANCRVSRKSQFEVLDDIPGY